MCRLTEDGASAALVRQARRLAEQLSAFRSPDAAAAYLLAGRAALARGRPRAAAPLLAAAARSRRLGPALSRASGWLALALQADADRADCRALAACRRGLAVLREHHVALGAPELRARATADGAELSALALRICLRTGDPRRMLVWAERWRATVLSVPATRPPTDRALRSDLTRYRELVSRSPDTPSLRAERQRLERRVRDRIQRRPGQGGHHGSERPLDVPGLLAALGDRQLVEIVEVDGGLQVLLCDAGAVRRFRAGRMDEVVAEVAHARAALHWLAHDAATRPGHTAAALAAAGRRLEGLLLGDAARRLRRQVVVVPPARLYAVPWTLLPSLATRAVSVAPSARAWQQARSTRPSGDDRVLVVRGPGLTAAAGEVAGVAGRHPGARLLDGDLATTGRVLAALDGCRLAHLAVHGTFRADSPLFSSLQLADGPLTVHDFERLHRAPHRLVLPACESGRLAPAGADELLGLAVALLPLGTASVVASVVPVNDAATTPLMLALHDGLRRGAPMAEALRAARMAAGPAPVAQATAHSFLALGAG